VFEALGLERPHVVASSMGGRFAIDYAVTYPDALRSLVVHAGGISGDEYRDPAALEGPAAVAQAVARGDFAEAMRLVLDFAPMRRAAADPAVRARLETIIGDHAWRSFTEPDPWLDAETPATEHLGEIGVPTLVLTGEHDIPDHHRQARLLADGIPDARLVVIPDAGHMVYMEQPELFNEAVLEFLATLPT
jgi:3-oxoadipate enol-lactonase